jgi:hypothetical protein
MSHVHNLPAFAAGFNAATKIIVTSRSVTSAVLRATTHAPHKASRSALDFMHGVHQAIRVQAGTHKLINNQGVNNCDH